jgi:hypothetical protein
LTAVSTEIHLRGVCTRYEISRRNARGQVPRGLGARNPAELLLSSSTISFFWALKKRYAQLGHHNMFLADGAYRESFEAIFEGNTLPAEPSFYINAPSRTDGRCVLSC